MKKWAFYLLLSSTLIAEEATPPEASAQQEIENFSKTEENAPPSQEKGAGIIFTPTAVRASEAPHQTKSNLNIILNNDAPPLQSQATAPSNLEPTSQEISPVPFDPEGELAALEEEEKQVAQAVKSHGIIIDLGQVFAGSPTIYTILFFLSIASLSIWSYTLIRLRSQQFVPEEAITAVRKLLKEKNYDNALEVCEKNPTPLFQMVAKGIQSRDEGLDSIVDHMKAEGRRATTGYWQKISLLNDIAVIAPMLGLLGTVLGMFYAFYDLNRSMESISALFDGLGISIGTTLGGLIVAILALTFQSMSKYRLTRQLVRVENEAESLANLIED